MNLSTLFHRIGFDIDYKALEKLDSQLYLVKEDAEQVFGGLSKVAQGVGKIGQALSLYVTAPLLGLGALSVKTSSDVEQLKLALENVAPAGTNLARLYAQLDSFTKKTGGVFDREQVYEYANSLIQVKTPISDITVLLQKLGDIAVGIPKKPGAKFDMTNMISALTAMKTHGQIGISEALAFGPAVMMQLQKQLGMHGVLFSRFMSTGIVSADTVMRAINTVSSQRAGSMIRQSSTLAGLMHNLGVAVRFLADEFGQLLIKDLHLKEVLARLTEWIYKLLAGFKALPSWVRTTMLVTTGLIALLGPLLMFVSAIGMAVISISGAVIAFAAIGPVILTIISAIGAAVAAFAPWLVIIGAVGYALWLLYDDIKNWVEGNKSLIGVLLGPWVHWRDSMIEFFKDVGKVFVDFMSLLQGRPDAFINDMKTFADATGMLFTGKGGAGNNLADAYGAMWSGKYGSGSSSGKEPEWKWNPPPVDLNGVYNMTDRAIANAYGGDRKYPSPPTVMRNDVNVNLTLPPGTAQDHQAIVKEAARQTFTEEFNRQLLHANAASK
jgi:hypothetical protein